MPQLERSIYTERALPAARSFLADYRNTRIWNTAVIDAIRIEGGGAAGTIYRTTARYLGREQKITWLTDEAGTSRLQFESQTGRVRFVETYDLSDLGAETRIRWTWQWTLTGPAALLAPLLSNTIRRIADESVPQLTQALGRS